MRRIQVMGTSGSGKTTLARALSASLAVPAAELDALFWKPGWQMSLRPEMEAKTAAWTGARERWIVDGNYSYLQPMLWQTADTLIWLDLPRWRNLWNVGRRGLKRLVTREAMWGHSRESLARFFGPESLLRFVWTTHRPRRKRQLEAFAALTEGVRGTEEPAAPRPIRLTSYAQAAALLETLARTPDRSLIEKVMIFAVRERRGAPGRRELLVFTHPETGLVEVVRGTVDPGEALLQAAARELAEEAGVDGAGRLARFSVQSFVGDGKSPLLPMGELGRREFQLRHAFYLSAPDSLPESWVHEVFGAGEDKGHRFACHWLPLDEAPRLLEPGAAAFLEDLSAYLGRFEGRAPDASAAAPLPPPGQAALHRAE
jgi:adenylate kinase family enzyme/8-oxo-dGTP pyrophosphatase MutT (NUDIX family)